MLDPVDVVTAEVRDAARDTVGDVSMLLQDAGRLVGSSVHLVGELLLQVGVRGRLVRLLVGQPLRETCPVGSWGGRSFARMEAER